MSHADAAAELAALNTVVLGTLDDWKLHHPQPLPARKERASIKIAERHVGSVVIYSITVKCKLASQDPMSFHGLNLAIVAESARFAVERNIETELRRREQPARDDAGFRQRFDVAR